MKKPEALSIRDVEKVAGPVEKWAGNCHAVACAIVAAKLVKGEAIYGHWTGDVHPKSMFYGRSKAGFCRHGWVELEDGRVLDPTRWVFENVKPYISISDPADFEYQPCECGHLEEEHGHGFFRECEVEGCGCLDYLPDKEWPYDEGGNQLRAATHGTPPPMEPPWKELKIEGQTVLKLEELLGRKLTMRTDPSEGGIVLGQAELFWIANLSYDELQPVTLDVYRAITEVGDGGFIPIDNKDRARREDCAAANRPLQPRKGASNER